MNIIEPELLSRLLYQFNIFLKGLSAIPLNIPGTQYHCAMRATDMIRKELQLLLRRRRLELEMKVASPMEDILTYLLVNADENGKLLPEADIVNEMFGLLFAGHDTMRSAISLLIKYLGEQPRVHEKVFQG
ncbi:hypothetical protein CRG98_001296 [Punica granatum]|nr:hypothetical protein CRG98_001296 [Punica granatum]